MSRVFNIGGSHFSGTRNDPGRGYVFMPSVDSREAVSRSARMELVRRSCEAHDNDPFVRGLIMNATRLVCGTVPKARTGDEAWDKAADAAWERATGTAEVFDVGGRFDGAALQKAIFHTKYRVGDGGVLLVQGGSDGGTPRVQFFEGWQIGDDTKAKDRDRWRDGLRVDRNGKAQRYRTLIPGEKGEPAGHRDYSREDFVHFLDYERPGQKRGLPRTYHMLNGSLDQREVEYLWMGGIKSASQVGWYATNVKRTADGPRGFGQSYTQTNNRTGSGSARTEGGYTRDSILNESTILELEQDQDLKILHDERPMPQQVDFLDYRKRGMAAGFGLPVEVAWNLANLNSANMRATLLLAQGFIDEERMWWSCGPGRRLRNWVIASEMKAGRLAFNDRWYVHEWMPTARLTADFAKDGRVLQELADTGQFSPDRVGALAGIDQDREDEVTLRRWVKRREMASRSGFDVWQVWSRPNGGQVPEAGASGGGAPEVGDDDEADEFLDR